MIFLIIAILVSLIFIMPIGIRVTYNDQNSDVDLYFYKLFNIKLDLDQFVRWLFTTKKNRDQITWESFIHNMKVGYAFKNIGKSVCHFSKVKKITFVLKENYERVYLFVSYWILSQKLSSFLHQHFKAVHNEYYMTSNQKLSFSFETIIEVRIIYFLLALIKNIKDLPKILKAMKS